MACLDGTQRVLHAGKCVKRFVLGQELSYFTLIQVSAHQR